MGTWLRCQAPESTPAYYNKSQDTMLLHVFTTFPACDVWHFAACDVLSTRETLRLDPYFGPTTSCYRALHLPLSYTDELGVYEYPSSESWPSCCPLAPIAGDLKIKRSTLANCGCGQLRKGVAPPADYFYMIRAHHHTSSMLPVNVCGCIASRYLAVLLYT
jgi:hypothetical protein